MRAWGVWACILTATGMAWGACGGGATVRDRALHLAWVVERDCDHPERPDRLVEVPWAAETVVIPPETREGMPVERPRPEVRSGMMVIIGRGSDKAEIHLRGTALGTARTGEKVRVRAGVGAAALDGIVRGPGLVELVPRKGEN